MQEKFLNKYRIPSARASWWDYGWNGAYFITICTQDQRHFFGKITHEQMQLSNVGVLADVFWHQIPQRLSYVALGAFVIMPNHMHGILILNSPELELHETAHVASSTPTGVKNEYMAARSPQANSVSSIIRSYKSAVTYHAHRLGITFGWQARFHDHIIRNDIEYQRINNYIEQNTATWGKDKFYTPHP
jgi:putative transposase